MSTVKDVLVKSREYLNDITKWSARGMNGRNGEKCVVVAVHHFAREMGVTERSAWKVLQSACDHLFPTSTCIAEVNDGHGEFKELSAEERHKLILQMLDEAINRAPSN